MFRGGSDHSSHDTDPECVYNSNGREVCSCKFYSHHEDWPFLSVWHKMAAWSINHDDRHCLFHIGTILKLKAPIYEMDEQHFMKYEILNILAKY